MTQQNTEAAMTDQFEIVAYEYLEHRPYGAPGEKRRGVIFKETYRLPDGTIAGDYEWVVEQFRKAPTTIMIRPLWAQIQP